MSSKSSRKILSKLPRDITRRDFIGATMIGAGSALLYAQAPAMIRSAEAQAAGAHANLPYALLDDKWTGPGGIGDYATSNGNTHEVVNERRGGVLHLNPGECCGWVSGRCTAAVLDTDTLAAEIIEL